MSNAVLDDAGAMPLPQAMSPCQQRLDARSWHATLALHTGAWTVGVRVNTAEAAALIDERFAALRQPALDSSASPNFSVELGDIQSGGRRLQIAYRDSEVVARRREVDDLLLDLTVLLDEVPRLGILDRPVLHATGLVDTTGEAMLVPATMHKDLLTRRAQLEEAGLQILHNRTQVVDPRSGELVLDLVEGPLAELAESSGYSGGRRRLSVWCLPAMGGEQPVDVRRPAGVYYGCSSVLNRYSMGVGQVLRQLAELAPQISFVGLPPLPSSRLARALVTLAG